MSIINSTVGTYTVNYPTGGLNNVTIAGYSPNQIKEQLVGQFRELANATINVNNGVVTFTIPSGQKNAIALA